MWSQLTLKMKTPPRLLLITLVLIIGASVVLCTTQADTSSIHASIDDVSLSLSNLKTNKTKYTNAFDEPFFAYIKRLHEQYGAKFSLYCYLSDIKDIGTSYQHDFANTSDWLKFGLHAPDTTRGLYTMCVCGNCRLQRLEEGVRLFFLSLSSLPPLSLFFFFSVLLPASPPLYLCTINPSH